MTSNRESLPQLSGTLFLTDAGIETTLIFYDGIDLPCFATFPLLETGEGRERLRDYYRPFLRLARDRHTGFILDTLTWRANADWGTQLGYDMPALERVNRESVAFAAALAQEFAGPENPVLISGTIGPRHDAYQPETSMSPEEAERYHRPQIAALVAAGVDLVSALTLTSAGEAIGIARAAHAHGTPAVLSFTVETNGRLPNGDTIREAIETVDRATSSSPAYYMINCAHPTHLEGSFEDGGTWRDRVLGLRANASAKSHAELDEATEIDAGDPVALAEEYVDLRSSLPRLAVLGGCCGTDYRHVEAIATAWETA